MRLGIVFTLQGLFYALALTSIITGGLVEDEAQALTYMVAFATPALLIAWLLKGRVPFEDYMPPRDERPPVHDDRLLVDDPQYGQL